ncbi:hypothetical protein GW17_00044655 [Ensete ventricosum]|nr:hypothetical protein GW17_00044655 [Ensete ventricosum]
MEELVSGLHGESFAFDLGRYESLYNECCRSSVPSNFTALMTYHIIVPFHHACRPCGRPYDRWGVDLTRVSFPRRVGYVDEPIVRGREDMTTRSCKRYASLICESYSGVSEDGGHCFPGGHTDVQTRRGGHTEMFNESSAFDRPTGTTLRRPLLSLVFGASFGETIDYHYALRGGLETWTCMKKKKKKKKEEEEEGPMAGTACKRMHFPPFA